MNVGMLWFDNDPKTQLDDKIQRAASYYTEKYGNPPTVCFVHPSMIDTPEGLAEMDQGSNGSQSQASINLNGIELRSNHSVLPNHFWIGINGTTLVFSDR